MKTAIPKVTMRSIAANSSSALRGDSRRGFIEGEQGGRWHEGGGHRHPSAVDHHWMARQRPESVRQFREEIQHGVE